MHHPLDGHEFEQALADDDGLGSLMFAKSHTLLSDSTELKANISIRKMHWLVQGLRESKVQWEPNVTMTAQN